MIGIPITFIAAALFGAAKIGLMPRGTSLDYFAQEPSFIRSWNHILKNCGDAKSALAAIQKNKEGGTVVDMSDGAWVAIVMEHHCCTGAGFNATLYVTSAGESFLDSTTCYCGFMPLGDELRGYKKTDLKSFLDSILSSGKQLTKL